jgi:hypothetical protein
MIYRFFFSIFLWLFKVLLVIYGELIIIIFWKVLELREIVFTLNELNISESLQGREGMGN